MHKLPTQLDRQTQASGISQSSGHGLLHETAKRALVSVLLLLFRNNLA